MQPPSSASGYLGRDFELARVLNPSQLPGFIVGHAQGDVLPGHGLNGVEAPEKNLCGYDEAKNELEKLILGKKVFIKIVYLDKYRRNIADVYTKDGRLIAQTLAEKGTVYVTQKKAYKKELTESGDKARAKKRGLFGPPCTQETNLENPDCQIKGNLNNSNKNRTYFLPTCTQYKNAHVQLYLGDQWFCSEEEATKAGFTKGKQCP